MKTIILVRHAKSSWKEASLEDHERPLNKRGERDAPHMAKVFCKKNISVDLIVSSTANRALSTANEFAKQLAYNKDQIEREKQLYLAEPNDMMDYVASIDDAINCVMLFGHNPGITWFATILSGHHFENIPTCGIAAVDLKIDQWSDLKEGKGKLLFFEYPKLYFKDAGD